jgi:hypothetical protein
MPATTQSPLAELVALHRTAVNNGDYVLLGQIEVIETAGRGRMDFRHSGPLVAQMRDRNDLLITTDFPALPPLVRALDEACPGCAATCEQCQGNKVSMCHLCGGAGKTRHLSSCAGCIAAGKYRPDCHECEGLPVTEWRPCAACGASGKRTCSRCGGAGVTGLGRTERKGKNVSCPDCEGSGRKLAREEQPLSRFAYGQIEGFVALGPVRAIVFRSLDGPARIEIVDVRKDVNGNLMALLLDSSTLNQNPIAYLVGGQPTIRPRQIG